MYDDFFGPFYECGLLFKAWQNVIWKRYPKYATDVWDSMGVLIPGSYEHQGTNKLFHLIALEALDYCKARKKQQFDRYVSRIMWNYFKKKMANNKLNVTRNPLAPQNYEDKIQGYSIAQFINHYDAANKGLVSYLGNVIKKSGIYQTHRLLMGNHVKEKNDFIPGINGIGTKIASMLLRDIVVFTNINVDSDEHRYLLQPVDKWVRRTIELLANKQKMRENEIQNWIIENCNDYNPEIVAMGIWYYCTEVAEYEYNLKTAMKDSSYAIAFYNEHRNTIRAKNQAISKRKSRLLRKS